MPRGVPKKKSGNLKVAGKTALSDSEIDDMVSVLWENIDSLPVHIQALLHDSQDPGPTGVTSYMLAAGWVIGKLDYVLADPWKGTKAGWVSSSSVVN